MPNKRLHCSTGTPVTQLKAGTAGFEMNSSENSSHNLNNFMKPKLGSEIWESTPFADSKAVFSLEQNESGVMKQSLISKFADSSKNRSYNDDSSSSFASNSGVNIQTHKEARRSHGQLFPSFKACNKVQREDFPMSFKGKDSRKSFLPEVKEIVSEYFNKTYFFSPKSDWELPDPSKLFSKAPWEVKDLVICKIALNKVKEKLSDLNLQDWHTHTKRRNKAGSVLWQIRTHINPEFPTQAWCKFYENVCSFALVPEEADKSRTLRSVHLCEAPGAFITSLNHYLRSEFGPEFDWKWLGTTLNPHYEGTPLSLMINEDRFILRTMDHWFFGQDQTGNLMNPLNCYNLIEKSQALLGDVLLVTADGSIDCQGDPGEQEKYVAVLHYCESVAALQLLAKGGSFLLKIFTVFEHNTVCLLYLLCCVFERVTVNKPATSKEGNSETYVVCEKYKGKEKIKPWLDVLMRKYGPILPEEPLFPLEAIPKNFIEQVTECANKFTAYQTDIIEGNLRTFLRRDYVEERVLQQVRGEVANEFFCRYQLKKIPEEFDLVGRNLINHSETLNLNPRVEVGTFNDKLKRLKMSDTVMMHELKADVERVRLVWREEEHVVWRKLVSVTEDTLPEHITIITGKPVKRINSSKFCMGYLLDIRYKVQNILVKSGYNSAGTSSSTFLPAELRSKDTVVLDFKNKLWESSDAGFNAEEEHTAFKRIINSYNDLSQGQNLAVLGYPLLTQFIVGLVYLLGHSFGRVGLMRPEGENFAVVFEDHLSTSSKVQVKKKLEEISEYFTGGRDSVLGILPIQDLCRGDFYRDVSLANNLCVKEQVLHLINGYLASTSGCQQ